MIVLAVQLRWKHLSGLLLYTNVGCIASTLKFIGYIGLNVVVVVVYVGVTKHLTVATADNMLPSYGHSSTTFGIFALIFRTPVLLTIVLMGISRTHVKVGDCVVLLQALNIGKQSRFTAAPFS